MLIAVVAAVAALHERLMLMLTSREGERVEVDAVEVEVEVEVAVARCPQTAHPRVLFWGGGW